MRATLRFAPVPSRPANSIRTRSLRPEPRRLLSSLTVKVAADGTFTRPFVVMAHIETGKRPLTGTVVPASAPGLAGPLVATTDLLVVRGALQPPDFIFRN